MPRNTVQFRKGLSEPEFENLYGTEDSMAPRTSARRSCWRGAGRMVSRVRRSAAASTVSSARKVANSISVMPAGRRRR
jgi:hypothetical protein